MRGLAERPRLTTPRQLAAYLLPQYGAVAVEQFGIVVLDTRHRAIRVRIVSVGSLDSTIVHRREVFREAASASAAAVVLFHNHPSGDPTPARTISC
jgi:DNA repair protein RadC